MIEKKTPAAPLDLDNEETDLQAPSGDYRSTADEMADATPIELESGNVDQLAKRKKRNDFLFMIVTGAIFLAVIVWIFYPRFKHYFVHEQPQQEATGIPVPPDARTHHFSLNDNGTPAPQAPSGAVTDSTLPVPVAAGNDASPAPSDMAQSTNVPLPLAADPNSSTNAPGANPPLTAPVAPAASQPKVDEVASHVAALQTSVDSLLAQKDAYAAQLQQIQVSIDNMQNQLASMNSAKKTTRAAPMPENNADRPAPAAAGTHSTRVMGHAPNNWVLRSAMPGSALISKPGSNDLQHISVGDIVSKLGKITSIEEQNGKWVVQGTSGSVSQ